MSSFIDSFQGLYSQHPLSRIPAISKFYYFELFIWFPQYSHSVRYLELRYLELSLCRTIFSVHPVTSGLFLIRYLEHSHESFRTNHTAYFRYSNVNNCIHKTLSGSLFFLFFNIVLATTCKNSMEKVWARNIRL